MRARRRPAGRHGSLSFSAWWRRAACSRIVGVNPVCIIVRRLFLGMAIAALSGAAATSALAMETLVFRVAGEEAERLEDRLRRVSVLADLQQQERAEPRDVIAATQADYANLLEALYAEGRYSAVINIRIDGREAALIDPFEAPDRITRVVVRVEPGRPFRFGRTRIAPLAPGERPPEAFREAAPARATIVRDAATGVVAGWRAAGHAKAEVADQDIAARHAEARLDVDVAVAPGPRVTFGDVVVTSESAVRSPRIRQIAGIPRGEVFMPDAVEKAATRLRRTGTFRSVRLTEADTVRPDGEMDIEIDVVDAPPRRIGAGVALSSVNGLTLSGFWLHRNFLGGAERFRLEGEAAQLGGAGSGPDFGLSFRFERPAVYGADTLFFLAAGLDYLDEPDFIEERANLALGVSQEFTENLTGELGLALSYSRVTELYLPKVNGSHPTRELLLFSLPAGLTYDRRDDALDPTRGYYLEASLDPFVALDADIDGARLDLDARAYRGFGAADRVVAAGRLQFGSLTGPSAFEAPPRFLYYSGGGGSVRGQPYQSLDADYDGTALGGRSFVGLSGELRIGVTERAGVVLFADAGYVGPESLYDGTGAWHAGGGIGARYDTPVGPIRLDVAGPLAGDTGDGAQFYVGIGQAF